LRLSFNLAPESCHFERRARTHSTLLLPKGVKSKDPPWRYIASPKTSPPSRHVIPCLTTRTGVKRQNAHTTALPCNGLPKSRGDVVAGHWHNLRAFPLLRRVLLLVFSNFAHDRELATLLNHSLSFHQPCIRSTASTMIVPANSHAADYWWEAGGLFKVSAITAATE
jgi:hypothetical protein